MYRIRLKNTMVLYRAIMIIVRNTLKIFSQRLFWRLLLLREMAGTRYEYVKSYEQIDSILPNVWIVVRIDGKKFHKFSKVHNFIKPNDANALNLMNTAAITVMEEFKDIILSYGQSDEYSFVFHKKTNLFNRRLSKLLSYVTSLFTSSYVMHWKKWMLNSELQYSPCFDGRVVLYPSDENLRDYLSWRQADVHINNLYNTTFWNLVLQEGLSNKQAEEVLRGTLAAEKNEILHSRFGINYNNLPLMFRKGTILLRKRVTNIGEQGKLLLLIVPLHEDIANKFWDYHTELFGKYIPNEYTCDEFTLKSQLILSQVLKTQTGNSLS